MQKTINTSTNDGTEFRFYTENGMLAIKKPGKGWTRLAVKPLYVPDYRLESMITALIANNWKPRETIKVDVSVGFSQYIWQKDGTIRYVNQSGVDQEINGRNRRDYIRSIIKKLYYGA